MIPYPLLSFIAVSIFALVHLWAKKTRRCEEIFHGRFLSAGGGVAIAYVFVDLLPKLGKSEQVVSDWLSGLFPFVERHVYLLALMGFLLFFAVDRSPAFLERRGRFMLSLASYTLFNFFVGYAVVDKNNPETRPLVLFTTAIALHYFTNDYSLSESYGAAYEKYGKWLLIGALFLGWFAGCLLTLPEASVALISAFIGGGVIMNVTRHELPQDTPKSLSAFLIAAAFYTILLLFIGH